MLETLYFERNMASNHGIVSTQAIQNLNTHIILRDSLFRDNYIHDSGVIVSQLAGTVEIADTIMDTNRAGVLSGTAKTSASMYNCTVVGNEAGIGIAIHAPQLTFKGVHFERNHFASACFALLNFAEPFVTHTLIENNVFLQNNVCTHNSQSPLTL